MTFWNIFFCLFFFPDLIAIFASPIGHFGFWSVVYDEQEHTHCRLALSYHYHNTLTIRQAQIKKYNLDHQVQCFQSYFRNGACCGNLKSKLVVVCIFQQRQSFVKAKQEINEGSMQTATKNGWRNNKKQDQAEASAQATLLNYLES